MDCWTNSVFCFLFLIILLSLFFSPFSTCISDYVKYLTNMGGRGVSFVWFTPSFLSSFYLYFSHPFSLCIKVLSSVDLLDQGSDSICLFGSWTTYGWLERLGSLVLLLFVPNDLSFLLPLMKLRYYIGVHLKLINHTFSFQ